MTIVEIVAGTRRWTAEIGDDPAARDFLTMFPLELTLKDYAGTEKIADLPRRLTRDGAPSAITPRTGDITFYAPWGNLAIFYKDGHHSPGLVPLGHIRNDAAALAGLSPTRVVIQRVVARHTKP